MRNTSNILVEIPEEKRTSRGNNIKMDVKAIAHGSVDWIQAH